MRTALAVLASSLLCTACPRGAQVIPDPSVPHQVASETTVEVWARLPTGEMARTRIRLLEGWWVVAPEVADHPTSYEVEQADHQRP
jgi:hypothetical protein